MRMSLVAPALTLGLLSGWAALANADAPPAAPIFYCPTPGKAAPVPAKGPAAAPAHVVRVTQTRHHGLGCPTMRVATTHRYRRLEPKLAEAPPHHRYADGDVSASQAFIYRYERALHGFDARAAEQAWADGRSEGEAYGDNDHRRDAHWRDDRWAGHHDGAAPPHAFVEQAPLPPPAAHRPPVVLAPHAPPPPPHYAYVEHPPAPPPRLAYLPPAPPPPPERRVYVEHVPAPPPVARSPRPDYAWQDRESAGGAVRVERSEHASGWSYQEENGRGHYEHWSDGGQGGDRHDDYWTGGGHNGRADDDGDYARRGAGGDGAHWAERRGPCPPVQDHACTAGLTAHHGSAPAYPVPARDTRVYTTAGRDAQGFLTWPGKTPGDE